MGRRKSSLMTWLKMAGLLVLGAMFSGQVLEFTSKIPFVGDMINKGKQN